VDQRHNQHFRLHWTYSGKARNPRDARAIAESLRMAVVLVVEDKKQVRVLADSYLEEQGHQVLSAGTGWRARYSASIAAVDLLFTDLDLKGDVHAGIELAKAAVKLRSQPHVLYTTGRAITDGMKARFVPGSATLAKPYTVEELRDSLSTNFQIDRLRAAHP